MNETDMEEQLKDIFNGRSHIFAVEPLLLDFRGMVMM